MGKIDISKTKANIKYNASIMTISQNPAIMTITLSATKMAINNG